VLGETVPATAAEVMRRLASDDGWLLLDVRRPAAFAADDRRLPAALRADPERIEEWAGALPPGRPVVACCVHGHEVSRGAAAALRARGVDAAHLEGGVEGWKEAGLPTVGRGRMRAPGDPPSRWVTRARPKIDRVACPWLIRRFVDPDARIDLVPPDRVTAAAAETGAVPFDVPGAAYSHVGDGCTFDAVAAIEGIDDPAIGELAAIVRGADTGRPGIAPEAAGLLAVSLGLSDLHAADDGAMIATGSVLYDALYRWCRWGRREDHSWPPTDGSNR
jgi:rhodanese-related sulfurtransferase